MKMKVKLGGVPTMNAKQQKAAIKKAKDKTCALTVCIDERTGLLKILKGERCPPGYIKRVDQALHLGVMINPEIMDD